MVPVLNALRFFELRWIRGLKVPTIIRIVGFKNFEDLERLSEFSERSNQDILCNQHQMLFRPKDFQSF